MIALHHHSLVRSHSLLIRLLCTARFAHALRCTAELTHSILWWERLRTKCVDFIQFQPTSLWLFVINRINSSSISSLTERLFGRFSVCLGWHLRRWNEKKKSEKSEKRQLATKSQERVADTDESCLQQSLKTVSLWVYRRLCLDATQRSILSYFTRSLARCSID